MSYETELRKYLEDLCAALGHKNRHEPFQGYCKGLMLPIERKCVEPLAAHIDPGNVRSRHQSLHHFVADAPWSDRKLLDGVTQKVLEAAGRQKQWYWIIDDTGMPKKGTHSVGVSHQYCGQLGKQTAK
jgi:SRSO17 transposase